MHIHTRTIEDEYKHLRTNIFEHAQTHRMGHWPPVEHVLKQDRKTCFHICVNGSWHSAVRELAIRTIKGKRYMYIYIYEEL